jgi:hypothetical protein
LFPHEQAYVEGMKVNTDIFDDRIYDVLFTVEESTGCTGGQAVRDAIKK